MAQHPIVHIEISAHDSTEAGRWYREVFGWETQEFPEFEYTTFRAAPAQTPNGATAGVGGGFATVSEFTPAGRVVVFIGTDDVRATLEKITAHGGKSISDFMEVPNVGTIVYFTDPTGNVLGLIQPDPNWRQE
jgi:predicted enzyme related to lactoylglutathione lyase